MWVTAVAFGIFFAGFFVHLLVWRISLPTRQTAALVVIFFLSLVGGMTTLFACVAAGYATPFRVWEYLHVILFHLTLMFTYLIVYTSIEERSPSMTLLVFVHEAGKTGRTREEMAGVLTGIAPVEIRLRGMVRDHLTVESDGVCRLTSKGRAWACVFSTWRRFLKMKKGG